MNTERNLPISRARLDEIAALMPAVHARCAGLPPLDHLAARALPVALSYRQAHAAVRDATRERYAAFERARTTLEQLHERNGVWIDLLMHDDPSVGIAPFQGTPGRPRSVLTDADRLLELLGSTQRPYADAAVAELQAARDAASEARTQARSALNQERTLRTQARTLAGALQHELIAYRRMLRKLLGSSHSDYQLLRRKPTTNAATASAASTLEADPTPTQPLTPLSGPPGADNDGTNDEEHEAA